MNQKPVAATISVPGRKDKKLFNRNISKIYCYFKLYWIGQYSRRCTCVLIMAMVVDVVVDVALRLEPKVITGQGGGCSVMLSKSE